MGLENRYSVYPVAEMAHVKTESLEGTPVAIPVLSLQDGMFIEHVLVVVLTPAVGASNLTVGDEDTADGYIVAADATAAKGTIYGGDPTQRGAYLYDATKKGSFVKGYTAAKTLKLVLSAEPATSEGEYLVYIFGKRSIPL